MISWVTFDTLNVGDTFRVDPTKHTAYRKLDTRYAAEQLWIFPGGYQDGAPKRFAAVAPVLVMTDEKGRVVNL